jgi:hypothetical protein
VKGLPAANSNESPELVKWLGREFSIFRSDVKGAVRITFLFANSSLIILVKVKGSMEDGSELRNIADLADNILQHAPGLNATLGLYYRLAFIVCILSFSYPSNMPMLPYNIAAPPSLV